MSCSILPAILRSTVTGRILGVGTDALIALDFHHELPMTNNSKGVTDLGLHIFESFFNSEKDSTMHLLKSTPLFQSSAQPSVLSHWALRRFICVHVFVFCVFLILLYYMLYYCNMVGWTWWD